MSTNWRFNGKHILMFYFFKTSYTYSFLQEIWKHLISPIIFIYEVMPVHPPKHPLKIMSATIPKRQYTIKDMDKSKKL